MPNKLSNLRPYKSLILCRITEGVKLSALVGSVLDDTRKLLKLGDGDGSRKLVKKSRTVKAGELSVGFIHYREKQRSSWTIDSHIMDTVNHLILVCRRESYVAIYISDPRWRSSITKRFDKSGENGLGALRRIPSGLLNAAFIKGAARTLWLSGTHRRTSVKADSKILSGIELRDALDPLDDQTYFPTAARCVPEIEDKEVAVGVAPRNSRIWVGTSTDWNDFVTTVRDLLIHLEKTTVPEQAPLPVLAVAVIDPAKVEGAYDVGLMPPEALSDDPSMDAQTREEMESWAYYSDFKIVATDGPNVSTEILHKGAPLGTIDFTIDLSDPDRIKLNVAGDPTSQGVAELHDKALRACKRIDWVKIWYESGHTLNGENVFEVRHRDMPFNNYQWVDFSGYDVTKEKPSALDVNIVGTEDSLFCWVKNNWPLPGFGAPDGGWLVSDDGSMELADFIHLDDTSDPPKLSLIHAKGAGSNKASRGLSVSYYEVVTSQAVKNLRHLDRILVEDGLSAGLGKKISQLAWHNRAPSTREKMIEALGSIGANYERYVVVLQPHVTKAKLSEVRAKSEGRDWSILRQLDTLLLGAEADCHSLGARLCVCVSS
jgi:hypothetical protein